MAAQLPDRIAGPLLVTPCARYVVDTPWDVATPLDARRGEPGKGQGAGLGSPELAHSSHRHLTTAKRREPRSSRALLEGVVRQAWRRLQDRTNTHAADLRRGSGADR
jgi:hypothetical protein